MVPRPASAPFVPLVAHQVLPSARPPCAPLSPPLYRLNVLAAHDDVLYIAASSTEITRLLIRRSNGPRLLPLPSAPISPPTVVNNMRVAPFGINSGSSSLIMTAGSEQTEDSGRLVFLPLDPSHGVTADAPPPIARAYSTRTHSAWGLAVHPSLPQIAISTNSFRSVIYSFRPAASQSSSPPSQHGAHPLVTDTDVTELPADVNQLPSLFYEHLFLLRQLHRNNLPCVSFHPRGHMLACASIDCTFSVQDLQSSFRPWVYQSEQPISSNYDFSRNRERCWQTHWVLPSTVQYVSKEDDIFRFQALQRKTTHVWHPVPSPMDSISPLLDRQNYAVHRTQTKVIYDDNQLLEDSSPQDDHSPTPSQVQSFGEFEFDLAAFFDKAAESQRQASIYTVNHKPFFAKQSSSMFLPDAVDTYAEGHLLLVCYERKLELHHVPSHRAYNAANECIAPKIRKLDTLSLESNLSNLGVQIMFTNVIEVAPLGLLVCTAVNTGVLLVRILRAMSDSSIDKPSLFIERIIPAHMAVAGTCVIERPGDNIAEYCAELWIFTIDGCLQCWELTQDGYELDISTPL